MIDLGDPARLEALSRSELLECGAEEVFDRLTRLAARLLGSPISLLTLLDTEHQYVKGSNRPLGAPVPAAQSYCQYVVRDKAPFTVTDVRTDARIEDPSALIANDLITYCGVPLVDGDGQVLGSLCAMGDTPRQWSAEEIELLGELAAGAMTEMQLRVANRRLQASEREARESRERTAQMAGIVEAAEEAINVVDLEGRVTGWNAACERLYGWTAAEVIGRPLTEIGLLVEDTDDQRGFGLDARALAGESINAERLRRRRRDGEIIYVDISLTPLRDSACGIVGLTAVARDVTDRHRLQTELAASEDRFRGTFENSSTGVTITSLDGVLLDANQAFCAMVGYARDEIVGRPFASITDAADHDDDLEAARALRCGELPSVTREKRYHHRNGRIVLVQITASVVHDAAGTPLHLIGNIVDVTERRQAEQALADARELLDESQAVAHVGSWSYDLETGALGWSQEQFRLHGFEPAPTPPTIDELCARLPAADSAAFRRGMESVMAHPRDFEFEYRLEHPDGSVRILATSAKALPADPRRGRHARVSGTCRDVTAERRAQALQAAIEERQRRILEGLPDTMVILYDTDSRVVSMQGGLLAEASIDTADYIGRTLSEAIESENSCELPGLLRRALAGETTTIDHDSGRGRQFQIEFAPYIDADGRIAGALTVWRDITSRVAREAENRMLATMVEQSQNAMVVKDADGRVTEWRGGAEAMYGYTREEAVGRLLRDLIIPPEAVQQEIDGNAHVMAGGSMHVEGRRIRKDGAEIDVSVSVNPLRDATGEVTGIFVTGHDITEQVRERSERREIEERLRVTVEHAPIGVALIDLQADTSGRLLSVNAAFAALLGDPDPVAAQTALTAVVHPDDAPRLRADFALLAADASARTQTEARCLRPDGRVVWMLVTGATVPPADGAPALAVLHAMDIGERKRFEGQLQHLADHDPLTGLFNRRRFESELTRTISLARRYRQDSALLLLDLDGFKRVNDTLGHSYGDEMITTVAACLRDSLRETDIVARLGGDEFAVILAAADRDAALVVAGKLRDEIAEKGIVVSETRHASVTASVGVALIDGRRGVDGEALLAEADAAMYASKTAGRNQVTVAGVQTAALVAPTTERSWLARLREALDGDGFELHAQPIHGICAHGIEHHELLIRMRGDDGELIGPASFLPNAERFDLIQEIDRWVFGQALGLLARSEAEGRRLSLSVNMSGKTLNDPRLVDDLIAMLGACPIPADRLVVEVTETAAIVNIERAREVARALRGLGCRFALDDFGAGFACFYYLKHLEFDFVKIDGEFVKSLSENPTDQLVISAIVSLARGLGAETIAEYVGDDDAVARLRELGVDYGQGFHLGRPAPVDELFVASSRR